MAKAGWEADSLPLQQELRRRLMVYASANDPALSPVRWPEATMVLLAGIVFPLACLWLFA